MSGVGLPGGPGHKGSRHTPNKAKQAEYRHSEKGKAARKARTADPEVRARAKLHRQLKKRLG